MKKFIRYLYEYRNGRRVQNVGFVKVEESDDSAVIQIYGKGFPAAGDQTLEILLFYLDGNQVIGIPVGELRGSRAMQGYQLTYDSSDVGGWDIFRRIEGVILRQNSSQMPRAFASTWQEKPVDIERMQERRPKEEVQQSSQESSWGEMQQSSQELSREEMQQSSRESSWGEVQQSSQELSRGEMQQSPRESSWGEMQQSPRESSGGEMQQSSQELSRGEVQRSSQQEMRESDPEEFVMEAEARMEESMESEGSNSTPCATCMQREQPSEMQVGGSLEMQTGCSETLEFNSSEKCGGCSETPMVYKIGRQDLVALPRNEWKLANNHFLMHGCRNFHHLLSFEKDGECWLGVPGIYHPKEQSAAHAFGFGQFMKPEEGDVTLSEDEHTSNGEFGYWCRTVSKVIDKSKL